MAAPAHSSIENLTGRWVMNAQLSDDSDPILKFQGINWLMRKVLTQASIILSVKQYEDPSTGWTHLDTINKPTSGLPSSSDLRVLNFEGVEVAHPLFGKICSRTRYASGPDLQDEDGYLIEGLEEAPKYIHTMTDHLDYGAVTNTVYGFEDVEGSRRHTRHIVVKKGDGAVRVRLVYDYLGELPEED